MWMFNFCCNLLNDEINAMVNLLSMLEKVFFAIDKDNKRLWSRDPKGRFSVKSFYDELHGEQANVTG